MFFFFSTSVPGLENETEVTKYTRGLTLIAVET